MGDGARGGRSERTSSGYHPRLSVSLIVLRALSESTGVGVLEPVQKYKNAENRNLEL